MAEVGEGPRHDPTLHVHVIRHGETEYSQGRSDIETADDLTPEGVSAVEKTANRIAQSIKPDEEVAIWTSPFGRTIHTAKILEGVFDAHGVHLRRDTKTDSAVQVSEQFAEVKNFTWANFLALRDGGEISIGEKTFIINKAETNPTGLDYPEFFTSDVLHAIPESVKETWAPELRRLVESMERFTSVTNRMMKSLRRLNQLHDKSYRVVIVTHDALVNKLVELATGEPGSLPRGESVDLAREDDQLYITHIAGEKTAPKPVFGV